MREQIMTTQIEDLMHFNEKLQKENAELRMKIFELQSDYTFDFSFIENSDKKVFAHTGLPTKEVFYILLNLMSKFEFQYVCGTSFPYY